MAESEPPNANVEPAVPLRLEPDTSPRAPGNQALAERMEAACSAAMRGDLAALQAALQAAENEPGYSINAPGSSGRTALYQGCLGRNPDVVKYLLELGAVRSARELGHTTCMTKVPSPMIRTMCAVADRR